MGIESWQDDDHEHDEHDNGQVQGATQGAAGAISSLDEAISSLNGERGTFNVEGNGELDGRESINSLSSSSSSLSSSHHHNHHHHPIIIIIIFTIINIITIIIDINNI